jgi:type IV pilus assembly protein PilM
MAVIPGVWGIDLGQCALKALRVENTDGQVTATAFDYVEHPKILSQPDADPDQLTREALEKFLSRNSLKGDSVIISIPGQSGLARFVKLPPVEERKIGDIVRFEAKQQIPFNLDEVVWDYQKIGAGVVTDGYAMETEIGLFAIKRDTVNRYLQHFKDVSVEVNIVQMGPLALCNFLAYDLLQAAAEESEENGKKSCLVALDIGTDNSNLVITDGARIIWQRPIPLGGNHFTRALTKDMKLTFAKAEHLKRNATKSPDLKQILASLKPVLNDFVGEVQRSLGYFTNTHRDANVQYMVGLGSAFRLPGLQKFLSEKLQLDVRRLQKFDRLAGEGVVSTPVFGENVLSFAVAYGLALQGLGVGKLHTNLLPQEIRVERLIRAKKPWAVTAAATMLLGLSVMGMGYAMQYRGVAAKPVVEAMAKGKKVKNQVDDYEDKVKKIQSKIEDDKKAVKSVVIGQEERFNWLKFMEFLNEALPKPDGSNLSEEAKKIYWTDNEAARLAYQSFEFQQTGKGKPSVLRDEERYRESLIQCNIEKVYCVYSADLADSIKAVVMEDRKWASNLGWTLDDKLRDKLPEGDDNKGWVVELHGYTYWKDQPSDARYNPTVFIKKTLIDNINRLGAGPEAAQAEAAGNQPSSNASAAAPTPPAKPAGSAGSEKPLENKDPVIGRVSHALLRDFRKDPNPSLGSFLILGKGFADGLARSTPVEGGSTGPGGGVGPAVQLKTLAGRGGGASSWLPLTGENVRGGLGGDFVSGMKGMGMKGMGTGIGGGQLAAGGGRGPMGAAPRPPSQLDPLGLPTAEEIKTRHAHVRTEFIVLLFWREPTPSDKLLADEGG